MMMMMMMMMNNSVKNQPIFLLMFGTPRVRFTSISDGVYYLSYIL